MHSQHTLETLRTGKPPRPAERRHWICYHDPAVMLYDYPGLAWRKVITHKRLDRDRLVGDFVHILTRNSRSGRFALIGYMTAARTSTATEQHGKKIRIRLSIYGDKANQYKKKIFVDEAPWFLRYKDEMQGLSHGLQRIKDRDVLDALVMSMAQRHDLYSGRRLPR